MAQDRHFHSKRYKEEDRKEWEQSKSKIQQGKHLSPVVPCPVSQSLASCKLWRWLHPYGTAGGCSSHGFSGAGSAPSLQMTHIPRFSKLLRSPLHLWLEHSASHTALRVTLPAFQTTFWNLGGILPDRTTLTFCMHLKPHGWCQGLPPAGIVARLLSWLQE